MARPSKYSDELVTSICEQIADGQSLNAILKADNMPSKSTVMQWLKDKPEFCQQYARAKELSADSF